MRTDLITSAHLVRPFLSAPATATSDSGAAASGSSSGDDYFSFPVREPIWVRIESHHLKPIVPAPPPPPPPTRYSTHFIDSFGAGESNATPPYSEFGQWLKVEIVYVSRGPWDIALLKVVVPHGTTLYPISAAEYVCLLLRCFRVPFSCL